jgi:diguanylate cyclase (GGDEF)-like protein
MVRRPDIPFATTLAMFASFIVACGLTHVADIVVIWDPLYWAQGWLNAVTAALSVLTAISLVPLLPRILKIRSPLELERLNGLLSATAGAVADANREMEQQAQILRNDSTTDALTGVLNRRGFDERLFAALADARRTPKQTSLLMIDIDDFKAFNDTFGHPAGDACLCAVAGVIRESCQRPRDVVARFGGEEFAVIMEDTQDGGARHLAEKIRAAVAAEKIVHGEHAHHDVVTVSVGVGTVVLPEDIIPAVLLQKADQALYRAKAGGRNCVASDVSAVH